MDRLRGAKKWDNRAGMLAAQGLRSKPGIFHYFCGGTPAHTPLNRRVHAMGRLQGAKSSTWITLSAACKYASANAGLGMPAAASSHDRMRRTSLFSWLVASSPRRSASSRASTMSTRPPPLGRLTKQCAQHRNGLKPRCHLFCALGSHRCLEGPADRVRQKPRRSPERNGVGAPRGDRSGGRPLREALPPSHAPDT